MSVCTETEKAMKIRKCCGIYKQVPINLIPFPTKKYVQHKGKTMHSGKVKYIFYLQFTKYFPHIYSHLL